MATFTLQSATPTTVSYVDLTNYNHAASARTIIKKVNRSKATYNHVMKEVVVRNIVKVADGCGEKGCLTAPVVVKLSVSAPEGSNAAALYQELLKVIQGSGDVGQPVLLAPATIQI